MRSGHLVSRLCDIMLDGQGGGGNNSANGVVSTLLPLLLEVCAPSAELSLIIRRHQGKPTAANYNEFSFDHPFKGNAKMALYLLPCAVVLFSHAFRNTLGQCTQPLQHTLLLVGYLSHRLHGVYSAYCDRDSIIK